MSTYLVTGANGVVGRKLCEELEKRGISVRATVRSKNNNGIANVPVVEVGDIDGETEWTEALAGVDVVLHLAAASDVSKVKTDDDADIEAVFHKVNVDGTRHLAQLAQAAGVRRFVYVSSIGVHGNDSGCGSFDEESIPKPSGKYASSKLAAETALSIIAPESAMEIVIVRPPLVYGAGMSNNLLRLMKLIDYRLPLPLAAVRNVRSLIYIGNLVDAIIICATHPAAAGKTYLVSDDEDVSTPQLIRYFAKLMGKQCFLWPLPCWMLRLAGKFVGKTAEIEGLLATRKIDNSKIKRELGWIPPFSLEEGLADMVQWFRGVASRNDDK